MTTTKVDWFASIYASVMAFAEDSVLCGLRELLFKKGLSFEQKVAEAAKYCEDCGGSR